MFGIFFLFIHFFKSIVFCSNYMQLDDKRPLSSAAKVTEVHIPISTVPCPINFFFQLSK